MEKNEQRLHIKILCLCYLCIADDEWGSKADNVTVGWFGQQSCKWEEYLDISNR